MPQYTEKEVVSIINSLNLLRDRGFPTHPQIFDAWCGACITVPIELALLRAASAGNPEVLLTYRNDKFYCGWHVPGTILLPGDTEESALARLVRQEIGAPVSKLIFIDRIHRSAKEGRGQETALLFTSSLQNARAYAGEGRFFSLNSPPSDILTIHKKLLKRVLAWL